MSVINFKIGFISLLYLLAINAASQNLYLTDNDIDLVEQLRIDDDIKADTIFLNFKTTNYIELNFNSIKNLVIQNVPDSFYLLISSPSSRNRVFFSNIAKHKYYEIFLDCQKVSVSKLFKPEDFNDLKIIMLCCDLNKKDLRKFDFENLWIKNLFISLSPSLDVGKIFKNKHIDVSSSRFQYAKINLDDFLNLNLKYGVVNFKIERLTKLGEIKNLHDTIRLKSLKISDVNSIQFLFNNSDKIKIESLKLYRYEMDLINYDFFENLNEYKNIDISFLNLTPEIYSLLSVLENSESIRFGYNTIRGLKNGDIIPGTKCRVYFTPKGHHYRGIFY